ncbi:methyl-accepting chemotaxis protein [Paenibacillus sp. J22TS3]|uniref:methyl-accepting chemotaxis protein n=1 Tax=Paenibacillus sp. J22TS3 TaxID=2807192 RepID=UPI001B18BBAD|nr:HAMP domain-containing methyl-accepting chemotaxis protein [Paenibacillus sp. J22TS3]GIP21936.1 hypothetical protein J22TS3_22110 [Paenibacillus sp. J22TS3]
MRNLDVRKKIGLLIAAAFVLMAAIGGTGFVNGQRLAQQAADIYDKNLISIAGASDLRTHNRALEVYVLESMVNTDPKRRDELANNIADRVDKVEATEQKLKRVSGFFTEKERENLRQYNNISQTYEEGYKQINSLVQQQKQAEALALFQRIVTGAVEEANRHLIQLSADLTLDAEASRNDSRRLAAQANIQNAMIISAGLLLLLLSGFWIARLIVNPLASLKDAMARAEKGDLSAWGDYESKDEIGRVSTSFNTMMEELQSLVGQVNESALTISASSQELTASSEQTAHSAEHIASATSEMAAGFDEQVSLITDTNNSSTHLADTMESVRENGLEMSRLSEIASAATETGARAMEAIRSDISDIETSVRETHGAIHTLSSHSGEIGSIVAAINDIAGQTSLLSLNASIEAARAGEQGRGFAVVAGEIRKLAESAAESSNQIAEIIAVIQSETNRASDAMERGTEYVRSGVERSGQAAAAFTHIRQTMGELVRKVGEVERSVGEAAAASRQISGAIHRVSGITQQGAAAIQETSAASEQQLSTMEEVAKSAKSLSALADELQTGLARFSM